MYHVHLYVLCQCQQCASSLMPFSYEHVVDRNGNEQELLQWPTLISMGRSQQILFVCNSVNMVDRLGKSRWSWRKTTLCTYLRTLSPYECKLCTQLNQNMSKLFNPYYPLRICKWDLQPCFMKYQWSKIVDTKSKNTSIELWQRSPATQWTGRADS